jgi:hypothetical protein
MSRSGITEQVSVSRPPLFTTQLPLSPLYSSSPGVYALMHELTNLCEIPLHQFVCHLGRDTLRYVRLLASYTSRSARYAARRASDLRRGLRTHNREACARSSARAMGSTGHRIFAAEGPPN